MERPRRCIGRRVTALARAGALLLLCAVLAPVAQAKDFGIKTPSGRRIYKPGERLADTYEQGSRQFVIEVVMGASAEGNLGANLGWLAPQLGGLELYGGFGVQANPSRQWVLSGRYWFDLLGLRPFVALGYAHMNLMELGTSNQSLFWEAGYKWRVHTTYHFTLGLGLRYVASVDVEPGSTLRDDDVDPAALQAELDDLGRLVPTIAFRFSRAF